MEKQNIIWRIIETIAATVFRFLFKVINKEYTKEVHEALMQFVRFGIVGVSNTVISKPNFLYNLQDALFFIKESISTLLISFNSHHL